MAPNHRSGRSSPVSTFGKIVCTVITAAVMYGIGRLMYWVIDTQGFLAGFGMFAILAIIVYGPWFAVSALRDRRRM